MYALKHFPRLYVQFLLVLIELNINVVYLSSNKVKRKFIIKEKNVFS